MKKKPSTIRTLLNKLLWDPHYKGSGNHIIEYKHRIGSIEIVRKTYSRNIKVVSDWYLVVFETSTERIIPFHRIIRIIDDKGNVLWAKS